MIRIYLAEDQSILQTALCQLLGLEDDIEVVGAANNGVTAWNEIQKIEPDVVVLDIEMPEMTGLDVADRIHLSDLKTRVIILTTFSQKSYFERAIQADVSGYLLKDIPSENLIKTIREVVNGKIFYSPELVISMVSAEKNPLTERELSVLEVAAKGKSSKQIANELFLTEGTVRNYLSAVFSKLGVHSRMEAVVIAKNNKWIS